MQQAAFLGPRRERCGLCSVYTPFPLQTNSFCLGGGEARLAYLVAHFLCALLRLCVPHPLPFPRAGSREARCVALCCAWQVSHCSSTGLSLVQVEQGSSLLSPELWSLLLFGP